MKNDTGGGVFIFYPLPNRGCLIFFSGGYIFKNIGLKFSTRKGVFTRL